MNGMCKGSLGGVLSFTHREDAQKQNFIFVGNVEGGRNTLYLYLSLSGMCVAHTMALKAVLFLRARL